MFKSITARFTALIVLAIMLSVAVVGLVSTVTLSSKVDRDAASIINLTCANEAQRINAGLAEIEDSVDIEASYAIDRLDSIDQFFQDEDYRALFTERLEGLFADIAADTNGAVSYYFRYNAEKVQSTQGFLYTRAAAGDAFEKVPLTDISLYDEDDDEHVGWYYIPLRNGGPTWLTPYDNKNLGIYMISYVVPVYAGDELVGIIGMDVDFAVVVNNMKDIHPYASGYAALVGSDGTVYYHPAIPYGAKVDGSDPSLPDLEQFLSSRMSGTDLVPYEYDGTEKRLTFQPLDNGMNLVLIADAQDIEADRNHLVANLLIVALLIIAAFTAIALASGKLLFRPLRDLTDAAREVSKGNLNVSLPEAGSSEVGTLIEAYRTTVDRMRDQLDFIDQLAHRDALTDFYNKSSFDEESARLDQAVAHGEAQFALVMIDANDLKFVNDTFGHERGDDYLKNAAGMIRLAFRGCDVFRVGGDEFVVVVEGADEVASVEARVARLDELCSTTRPAEHAGSGAKPWECISLASGIAVYDHDADHNVKAVLARADAAMYANKQRMKGRGLPDAR